MNFSPAWSNTVVCGSNRPGYPLCSVPIERVHSWINEVKSKGVTHVVCLLSDKDIKTYYNSLDLIETYKANFESVDWFPIGDYAVASAETLGNICDLLEKYDSAKEKVVVHCSAGMGRTGLVLTAWVLYKFGNDFPSLDHVAKGVMEFARTNGAMRVPFEAGSSEVKEQLEKLIELKKIQLNI